jgi:integrase
VNQINFTKAEIDKLKPRDERYVMRDTKVKGLIVRVSPKGIKTYQVYKKLDGKPKRVTVGRASDLTVEQARNKAKMIIGEMAYSNKDHNAEKRIDKAQTVTLEDVYDDYKEASSLRDNTLAAYKLAIDRDFEDWKNKPIHKITGDMVQKRHQKLSKDSKTSANKAMRVLRALFNFARDQYEDAEGCSLFPDNPTRKLKRHWNRESRRKGHIPQHQLKDWFKAVLALPELNKYGHGETGRDYLIFILLTGLRRREASSLLWSDIDLKARRFIVRDPKNHDELWMPLSDYLVNMLKARHKAKEEKETRPFPIEEPKKFIVKVREKSEVYFTVHDLRRTFITVAESLDIGTFTIKALVNHRSGQNDVTEGYIQINTERLRGPMQKITDFMLRAGKVVNEDNVVELEKKKS